MTIHEGHLKVRDSTTNTSGAVWAAIPRGLRPLGMAAHTAPSVLVVESLTFRWPSCIVPIPDGSTDAEEEFLRACSNGDKDLMKRFIARKVDVNTAEERSGNTGKWLLKDP